MISSEDIVGKWGLSFDDVEFINARPKAMRVGLAAQLKSFQHTGQFLSAWSDIPEDACAYLGEQLDSQLLNATLYDFKGRSARRHCAEIIIYLGFARMSGDHRSALLGWLLVDQCHQGHSIEDMVTEAFLWCRDHKVFVYSKKTMERLVRSARRQFLELFLSDVADRLSSNTVAKLEASLAAPGEATEIRRLANEGLSKAQIARNLGVSRMTVYRALQHA